MDRRARLLFGPLAALLLAIGVLALGALVPGYDQVRQTVSEIGEEGSPARIPFAILICGVSACLLVFASGVRQSRHGRVTAYLIACMAISAAGVGVFAFPHPLHNVFGQSELIGYQAPLALALEWRRDPKARPLVLFSALMFAVVWISIGFNLTSLDRHGALWEHMKPVYGLIQRSLFAAWFLWCALVAGFLRDPRLAPREPAP